MSGDLREPPAKKRKSRFGPQPSQDQPNSSGSSLSVTDDLAVRQQQALAVAASLSKQLGLDGPGMVTSDVSAPPSTSSFLQTASLFANKQQHQGLGYGSGGYGSGYGSHSRQQFEDRVFIPKDDYPDINFIGLILGPKGLNQKRMQSETGCRILVKGQGSSKNGVPIPDSEATEPLHVYVSADTKEKVELGVKRINDLIRESTDKFDEGGMEVKVHRHTGYIDVEIPNCQIGVVIGKQSQNIHRIQDTTGALINISASNIPENPLMKMITISGTNRQCEDALIEIHKTIEELRVFRARLQRQRQHAAYSQQQPPAPHPHAHAHAQHQQSAYHASSGAYQSQHYEHPEHRQRVHGGAPSDEQYAVVQHGHQVHHNNNNNNSIDSSNSSLVGGGVGAGGVDHHRDYGTASYDPNFAYPENTLDEEVLPKISSGAVESGLCEIEIPNAVVGLIIGKNASNVKAMKDRTRCDIRVQKDEETLPDADIRLVALKGCVQSIKAARQEIAKVIHMANSQKQGATLQTMHQQNYQQMMYQNQMMQYQQMMYQQQLGYGGQYGQYPMGYAAGGTMDAAQQQSYYAQWQQQQQQQTGGQTQLQPSSNEANNGVTDAAGAQENGNEKPTENVSENVDQNEQKDADDDQTHTSLQTPDDATVAQTSQPSSGDPANKNEITDAAAAATTDATVAVGAGAATTALSAEQVQQQQQYQQMLQSYGYSPQQIAAAYQQYQQYPPQQIAAQYQQYYQQYAQQYPQWAQYQASMQTQMQQQEAVPPPPPPPPPEDPQEAEPSAVAEQPTDQPTDQPTGQQTDKN